MNIIRDEHIEKLVATSTDAMDEHNEEKQNGAIVRICNTVIRHADLTRLSSNVLDEIKLNQWVKQFAHTKGGAHTISDILSRPTYNVETLKKRGDAIHVATNITTILKELKVLEPSVLWMLNMPMSLHKAHPLPFIFPSWLLLKHVNNFAWTLMLWHITKIFLIPFINVVQPLSAVVGPYFYMKRYLKIPITFVTYVSIIRTVLLPMITKTTGNVRKDAMKYGTILVYIVLYISNILHSIQYAGFIIKIRQNLVDKWQRIHRFIQLAQEIRRSLPAKVYQDFTGNTPVDVATISGLDTTLSSCYKVITTPGLRKELESLVAYVYVADAMGAAKAMLNRSGWTMCRYGDRTRMYTMGHPMLDRQVRNPLDLGRNIIITGPNAAGKTTYMKAICANIILAQTLGISCSKKCVVQPVHVLMSSMNVYDTVGKESLFEAEVRRCSGFVEEAKKCADSQERALFFLDEPMHSTPPIEGTAAAMAIVQHIGTIPGVRVFLTTHYHQVTKLESIAPNHWINVSMEAIPTDERSFLFPYRLRYGASFQCIAIELLKDRALPDEIIECAIEMKNKLCSAVVDHDNQLFSADKYSTRCDGDRPCSGTVLPVEDDMQPTEKGR
jgi:hypothetical protein